MRSIFGKNRRQLKGSEAAAAEAGSPGTSDSMNAAADSYTSQIQKYILENASQSYAESEAAEQRSEAHDTQEVPEAELVVESSDAVPQDQPAAEQKKQHHMKHLRQEYQTDSYTSKIQEYLRQKMH